MSCLLTKTNKFYPTNQVPTILLTWEQTSNLKVINLEKANNKASKYIQEKMYIKKNQMKGRWGSCKVILFEYVLFSQIRNQKEI
jgi:hypothetical protein